MPGRPPTDQQVRSYMEYRRRFPQRIAAAKIGVSERTGRRFERDPRLPSQKAAERPLRRQVADPLGGLWESDILPLLAARPGLRPVTLLEEMQRRHPDRDWERLRRTRNTFTAVLLFPRRERSKAAADAWHDES